MFFTTDFKLLVIFTILSIVGYIFCALKKKYDFWKDRGVPHVGFSQDLAFVFRKHRYHHIQTLYDQFSSLPYAGVFQSGSPYLMLLDLDLIKRIKVTNFSHFTDRGILVDMENDPLMNLNVSGQNGEKWKQMRTKLSPLFSSGKLRRMNILMNECIKTLDGHLERTLGRSDEIEVRELMLKFAMDVIGTCVYGLNCNAIEDENSEFSRVTKKVFSPRAYLKIIFMMLIGQVAPKISKWLGLSFTDPEVDHFFRSITRDAVKNREETAEKRDDFLQLIMNVRNEERRILKEQNDDSEPLFTDDVCTANLYVFFLAGYDTVATSVGWCLYDLALHPDIMEKLHEEIKRVQGSHDGTVDYDVLKKMKFLDSVISESLRLHSFAPWTERICTKTFQDPDSSLVIEQGVRILIPVQCIQRDPQYFPNPEKYDPDRFSEENKNVLPYSYMPFGDGPRICIARRFALMEMKAALALIIGKYSVHPCSKTEIPATLNPRAMNISPKALHLRFQRRRN